MRLEKRLEKEASIIDAAEKIFETVGFKNAKMEDIAAAADITKVTLYSYFQSKENLYLAITYRALIRLNEGFNEIIKQQSSNTGMSAVLEMHEYFMDFSSTNFLYTEALLDYFEMNRSSAAGEDKAKLTDAVLESHFYQKTQEIQNVPYKLLAQEVKRGQTDGSIASKIDPMLYTLHAWTVSLGYIKIISSAGDNTLFNIELKELFKLNLHFAEQILSGKVDVPGLVG